MRRMSEMNIIEKQKLRQILYNREIDFENETFEGGGSWEGGIENISFWEIKKALDYLSQIKVKI